MFTKNRNPKSRGFTPTPSFKNKENLVSGFTLIELLVVVAIIGILSGVVLSSLNNAREKGRVASIKSNLRSMIAQAELSYDTPGNYSTVCTGIQKMLDAITGAGGTASCYSYDNTRWGVSVKLNSDTTKSYSVDQSGVATWKTADVSASTLSWASANTTCASSGGRLPSFEQLKTLWTVHAATPPAFRADVYWTSSTHPASSGVAYYVNMTDGSASSSDKLSGLYVRCIY